MKEDFDKEKGRNEYIKAATGEWIFVIDADECILEDDLKKMKVITRNAKEEVGAYFLPRIEYLGDGKWGTSIHFLSRPSTLIKELKKCALKTGKKYRKA